MEGRPILFCVRETRKEKRIGAKHVGEFIETLMIAAVVSIGIIAMVKAIHRGLAISRRPSHHLAQGTGTVSVPPEAQIPPPNH
jgi:hypothetical protein